MNGKELLEKLLNKSKKKLHPSCNREKLEKLLEIYENDNHITLSKEEAEIINAVKFGFNKVSADRIYVDRNSITHLYSNGVVPGIVDDNTKYRVIPNTLYMELERSLKNMDELYEIFNEIKKRKAESEKRKKEIEKIKKEQESKRKKLNKKKENKNGHRGVYGIYIDNELVYVGMTNRDFKIRWNEHKECVKNPEIRNSQQNYLYKAMRENKFEFKVLCEALPFNTEKDIKCMEYALITFNKPKYNYCGVVVDYNWN